MNPPKDPALAAQSTRDWWSRPGIVYFVAAGEPAVAIKIGMTTQGPHQTLVEAVSKRLKAIQTGNHELIRLIGIVHITEREYPSRDAEILERELHLEFAHLARFNHGCPGAEWFTAHQSLIERIESISSSPQEFGLPTKFSETVNIP